jgi:hypothetical protein
MIESLEELYECYGLKCNGIPFDLSIIILKILNSTDLNVNDFDLENSIILNIIGFYYEVIKRDNELMNKYYLEAIKKGNSCAMHNLEYHYNENPLELFVLLNNIKYKNYLITFKIMLLRGNKRVKNYFKLLKSKKNKSDCCICLEIKSNLLPKCKHEICQDCFIKINKCPICRKEY